MPSREAYGQAARKRQCRIQAIADGEEGSAFSANFIVAHHGRQMFEPQLEHNRAEYTELNRKKWRTFVPLLALIVPMSVLAAFFPDYAWPMAVVLFVVLNTVFVWYEVKKTIVFRRDLRAQRGRSE
jgi:hypothetical protein